MKSEEIKSMRDAALAVRWLLDQREKDLVEIATLKERIESVESKQGFFAQRKPPKIPPFPRILRQYGYVPPEERKKYKKKKGTP